MFSASFGSFVAVFAASFQAIKSFSDGRILLNMVVRYSEEVRHTLARSVSINLGSFNGFAIDLSTVVPIHSSFNLLRAIF
jgi:hypothetical protein